MLELRVADGFAIALPYSLESITTYVLLEQEAWFEKEPAFLRRLLRPGMTAIDIGANLGVYSLLMAQLVGDAGHVFAFEPGSEARDLLGWSRNLNGARNLTVSALALSDGVRDGRLVFGASSELHALGDGGEGERVRITSLDVEDGRGAWPAPDFVKIDAEGEEERILAGGRKFFARHSPVVMFEIRHGTSINERLRAVFPTMGYDLYRLVPGPCVLIPHPPGEALDSHELNLFAIRPDRAASLREAGCLIDPLPAWAPDNEARGQALTSLPPHVLSLAPHRTDDLHAGYRDALAAYAVSRSPRQPLAVRCAALRHAFAMLRRLAAQEPSIERMTTYARVAFEWGALGQSAAASERVGMVLGRGEPLRLSEPFWPASERFDQIMLNGNETLWYLASAAEHYERVRSWSTFFSGASPVLNWLCGLPFSPTEMERRRVLLAARAGQEPRVPERLCASASDHVNAEVWRAGKVPGTVAG
jgi:FkbM family methyltransferase